MVQLGVNSKTREYYNSFAQYCLLWEDMYFADANPQIFLTSVLSTVPASLFLPPVSWLHFVRSHSRLACHFSRLHRRPPMSP
jgi:hypothetical protein